MPRSAISMAAAFAALIGLLAWAAVAWLPQTAYYPYVMMKPAPGISVEFVLGGYVEAAPCQDRLKVLRAAVVANCPTCENALRCDRGLDDAHRRALGGQPLDAISIRLADGVLLVRAQRAEDAQAVCEAIHRQMQQGKTPSGPCIPPGQPRPRSL